MSIVPAPNALGQINIDPAAAVFVGSGVPCTTAAVQFIGAAIVTIPIALLTETGRFEMVWQNWVGLLWSSLGLSVGAISLLLFLIRRGSVASVASLFYLVPPVVAVFAYLLFGEKLDALQIAGMVVAAAGVGIASRGPRSTA